MKRLWQKFTGHWAGRLVIVLTAPAWFIVGGIVIFALIPLALVTSFLYAVIEYIRTGRKFDF